METEFSDITHVHAAGPATDPPGPAALISSTGQIEAIPTPTWTHSPTPPGYLYDPSGASWPRPVTPTGCGAPWTAVRGCGCGVKRVRQHCDKRGCSEDYCRDKIRSRRSLKIERRLNAGRTDGRAVLYTVFTVPQERRQAAADKKTWKKWIDRLLRYMKKELAFDFGVERSDPCGEDGETWHPHVNLLWVRRQGFRGFLQPEQLDALKARWARIVYGGATDRPISVHTAFTTDEARIVHWCRYMGRTWSRWEEQFPYHLRIKWLGRAPKTPPKETVGCCEKCGLEVVRIQLVTEAEALKAETWTYERLCDEVEWARFERLRRFGRWKDEKEVTS